MKFSVIMITILVIIAGLIGYEINNTYSSAHAFRDALVTRDGTMIKTFLKYEDLNTSIAKKMTADMAKFHENDLSSDLPEIRDGRTADIKDEVDKALNNFKSPDYLSKIFSGKAFDKPGNYSVTLKDFNSLELFNEINKFRFIMRRQGMFHWQVVDINSDKLSALMRNEL